MIVISLDAKLLCDEGMYIQSIAHVCKGQRFSAAALLARIGRKNGVGFGKYNQYLPTFSGGTENGFVFATSLGFIPNV
jgi:hypothetical protein